MISLREARSYVFAACGALSARDVNVHDAIGWVLAEPAIAVDSVPPFVNSGMDGFAVRAADSEHPPTALTVLEAVMAGGTSTQAVLPGTAIRIMTGAPLPAGADAVCMVEHSEPDPDDEHRVVILDALRPGENVRAAGDDVAAGDEVFPVGTPIGPAHLGVLLSAGVARLRAVAPPRVGVLATGDELISELDPLPPGGIRDSNRPSLLARLHADGFNPIDLGTARDDIATIADAIAGAVPKGCDALLTIGGVSMGDRDFIAPALSKLGADALAEMKVAIRPAKPFVFAALDHSRVPVFGLPGNPVSSLVSYELLVRPALRKMAGYEQLDRTVLRAVAPDGLPRRPDGRTLFARVRLQRDGNRLVAHPLRGQGSHQLRTLADANGLAVVPDGDGIAAGEMVEVLVLDVDRMAGSGAASWIP